VIDPPPTREAGLDLLRAFTPRMGRAYASGRNHDPGPEAAPPVSRLSAYVRHRLLLEEELVIAARTAHGREADAFVDQVLWRTYWKAWLEHRPGVWHAYRAALRRAQDRLATEAGMRRVFHDAAEGNTGIDGFDAWARELVATNRLHNHARMWFASIWVFTLRLPWVLGADFFLRHLIDGDQAVNTLSWRWVAGLHTRGKCYVARAENIARYTNGRFNPAGQLDEAPQPIAEDGEPPPPVPPRLAADPMPPGEVALLLHDEDCLPESLLPGRARPIAALACVSATPSLATHGVAPSVAAFARGALEDAARRRGHAMEMLPPDAVAGWVRLQRWPVVAAAAPVGPTADLLAGLPVRMLRRPWDQAAVPHATRGFFQFRDDIPVWMGASDGSPRFPARTMSLPRRMRELP
jgi:deoxyribodipyrimidine photo-lyase